VDFAALDRRKVAPRLDLPVLLIAGTGDTTTPIAEIDAFADALPNRPTYLRLDGVEHVEGWNVDPQRYEAALAAFLAEVIPSAR
jgi:Homoserine acetyltransferase